MPGFSISSMRAGPTLGNTRRYTCSIHTTTLENEHPYLVTTTYQFAGVWWVNGFHFSVFSDQSLLLGRSNGPVNGSAE